MHDFGELMYLDPQKTGSTFISQFLRHCCLLPELRFIKHHPVALDRRPKTVYFISARNPFSTYASLYRFGCDGKGGIRTLLEHYGKTDLYEPSVENFEEWLRLVVPTSSSIYVETPEIFWPDVTHKFAAPRLGLATTRFAFLALPTPVPKLAGMADASELGSLYRELGLPDLVIKTESLNSQITVMARELFPRFFDQQKVTEYLADEGKVNRSQTSIPNFFKQSETARQIVLEQDWFLFEHIYPDLLPTAA
jgi:hypothetical protein